MNSKEMMMKYGGIGAVLLALILLLAYVGVAFTGEGYQTKFEKLKKLDDDIRAALRTKNFDEGQFPPKVPLYSNEIQKNWEKANLAQPASDFMVYPAVGIQFVTFDPSDKERARSKMTGRYLVLSSADEINNFFGPQVIFTRGEAKGLLKATPAKLIKTEQTGLDNITIEWEDTDPDSIEKSLVDEYQLFRYDGNKPNTAQRITPAGYKEKIFVDKNFNPRSKYSYYVITKVKTVTPYEPPFPLEETPSDPLSVETQT
ncbi:MAG: hypothetical protein AABZ60_23705, partial [Planctomycetota bacterium]